MVAKGVSPPDLDLGSYPYLPLQKPRARLNLAALSDFTLASLRSLHLFSFVCAPTASRSEAIGDAAGMPCPLAREVEFDLT